MTNRIGVLDPANLTGEALLEQLASMGFASDSVVALDEDPDPATRVSYGSTRLVVIDFTDFDFAGVDHVLIADAGWRYSSVVQRAVEAGCSVAALEPMGEDIPASVRSAVTVVPDSATLIAERVINAGARIGSVTRADVVALEPASARGQEALQRLAQESAEVLNARSPKAADGDAVRAFNALAAGGVGRDVGGVFVAITRVEVPVFFGDGLVCHIGFEAPVAPAELERALQDEDGVRGRQPGAPSSVRDGIDAAAFEAQVVTEAPQAVQQLWLTGDSLQLQAASLRGGLGV